MGLLTKIGGAFKRPATPSKSTPRPGSTATQASPGASSAKPAPTTPATQPNQAPSPAAATATLERPESRNGHRNGHANGNGNGNGSHAIMSRRVEPAPPAPRNKQELLEELQKNYREVVELVRKVDVHLDRDETRAQEFVSIARRVDETLPAIESAPTDITSAVQTLSDRVTDAIKNASSLGDKRVARLEQSLTRVCDTIDSHGTTQQELAHTMASFRETLNDIAATSQQTGRVLQTMETQAERREAEAAKMLKSSRNWLLASLAISLGVATVAMGIAIVSMINGTS